MNKAARNKLIRYPIVELVIDGESRHFFADKLRLVYVSIHDERESFHESAFNSSMAEILARHSITVH